MPDKWDQYAETPDKWSQYEEPTTSAQPQTPGGFWSSFARDVLPQTILGKYLGGTDIAQGIQTAQEPGIDPKLMAAHQIGTGALKLTAPLTAPFGLEWAAAHKIPAIAGMLAGTAGKYGGTAIAEGLGAPPGGAELTGDINGAGAGTLVGGGSAMIQNAIRNWRNLNLDQKEAVLNLAPGSYGTKIRKLHEAFPALKTLAGGPAEATTAPGAEAIKTEALPVKTSSLEDEVAQGFGAEGLQIRSDAEIAEVLARARDLAAAGRPVLVNVWLDKTEFREGSISM